MKKSLGQYFLINPKIREIIVDAAEIQKGDTVVEIGPGSGLLTDHLLSAGANVIAIEKDRDFIAPLREKYKGQNIEIVEADVLRYTAQAARYKIVGNLPYYLTSRLLRVIFQNWPAPELIVFMVQKEVADRMLAKPPDMNMLAVLVQYYTAPARIAKVGRGNFKPAPKVESAIIKLKMRYQGSKLTEKLLEVAAMGFKHPRKKLGNNLPVNLLKNAGIDPNRRAETLTVEEWKTLSSLES